ncbi:MAG: FHA domain-containing protein [Myxococcaceae bacterium]
MLSVKDMRVMAATLSLEKFRKQLGPFALIQRPPSEAGRETGIPGQTAMAKQADISQGVLSLLFEFEDLAVCTLPPLGGVDQLTIGRLPDCELVVDQPSVSKRHAVLRWNGEQKSCTVNDLGSTNGTYLNDSILVRRETLLRDGDILSFGDVQFWYLLTDTLHRKLGSVSGSYKLGARSG